MLKACDCHSRNCFNENYPWFFWNKDLIIKENEEAYDESENRIADVADGISVYDVSIAAQDWSIRNNNAKERALDFGSVHHMWISPTGDTTNKETRRLLYLKIV